MIIKKESKEYGDYFIPIIFLFFLTLVFHQVGIDEWIAGHFYKSGGWPYRDNFIIEKILHKGGALFSASLLVMICLALIWVWNNPSLKAMKIFFSFAFTSSLLTIIAVALLKKITTFPCPWYSTSFNGLTQMPSFWMIFSLGLPKGNCFPGGHSSGGFAFLSFYYAYKFAFGKRSFKTLIPGILIGLIFGLAQQARGAHYMSHDFATASVSIFCSWVTLSIYSNYNKKHENQIYTN